MLISTESWSTQQLVEFAAVVSDSTNELDVMQRAVERAAEAFEAEICAVVRQGRTIAAIGFPVGDVPDRELAAIIEDGRDHLELAGVGELRVNSIAIEAEHTRLL